MATKNATKPSLDNATADNVTATAPATADNATATAPATADNATATAPATADKKPRIAPELTGISTTVPMPSRNSKRGSKAAYPFDDLATVGASFGIKNKSAKNIASIVSHANKRAMVDKTDAAGNVIFKTQEMKAADGTVTRVPSNEPEKIGGKHFFAVDVDPANDPDGASVRVFRDK